MDQLSDWIDSLSNLDFKIFWRLFEEYKNAFNFICYIISSYDL